jgi:hypothetical protein
VKKLLALPLLTVMLLGCTPTERIAYNTVVASKAFLDSIKSKHPECTVTAQTTLCIDLRKATAAKDVIIDAGEAYCNETSFAVTDTTPCNPAPKGTPAYSQALSALNAAISGYNQAQTDLKAVIQ